MDPYSNDSSDFEGDLHTYETSERLEFMQWNIAGASSMHALLQSQTVTLKPDVVLLQETLLRENSLFSYKGYTIRKTPRTDTTRGLLTLVKDTMQSTKLPTIQCGEAELLSVEIRLGHTTLTLHNIYNSTRKSLEAENLFASISVSNAILAGDLNAHHPFLNSPSTNPTGRHLYSLLQDFPNVALLNRLPATTHIAGGTLDLMFIPRALHNTASWMLHPSLASDHFAILATVPTPKLPPIPPPPVKWNPDFAQWDIFERHMTTWALQLAENPSEDPTFLLMEFTKPITLAADASMPMKGRNPQRNHKDAWYYCPRIKEMNRRINKTHKLFRRHRTDGLLLLLRELIAKVVQVANKVKREKWLQRCSQISQQTSLKAIWAWFNKVSGSKRHQTKPTHPQPHQEAMNIGQTLANRTKSTNLCPATQARQEQLLPRRNDLVRAACNEPPCTDALYTSADLDAALAKCRDTAPGADGITYSMLKHLGDPAKNSYL
ncbi:uncharacterized protein [Palaemon carinicauda]|uniref:uncharacterized protein n=1 Tax=Palaemon carinicauda TaxID=392227 RepID=UPI0035B67E70